uniref:Uncharacterized protein n=1 Tax=Rhizophora mucronata TaxID=61149 RepID=A0A2P2P0T6_RHIMU
MLIFSPLFSALHGYDEIMLSRRLLFG